MHLLLCGDDGHDHACVGAVQRKDVTKSAKKRNAQSENRTPVSTLEGLNDNHYTNCACILLIIIMFIIFERIR